MLMKDPKKSIALILAKKMGSPQMEEAPESENGDELDQSEGYKAASEELLKAVESKNPEALSSSLKSFIEMCLNEQPEESEESEYSEEPKE